MIVNMSIFLIFNRLLILFEANRNLLDRKNISCFPLLAFQITDNIVRIRINHYLNGKLEKNYAPALDNYGQSCFVRSDFLKMKCVCKTQMMPPPPDHKKL